jgi:hypothetical protein
MFCIIFGRINAPASETSIFPPLTVFGTVLFCVGTAVLFIAFVMIKIRQVKRLQQAIAEESMKYSARSPTPCSWRLETTSNGQAAYYVSILQSNQKFQSCFCCLFYR